MDENNSGVEITPTSKQSYTIAEIRYDLLLILVWCAAIVLVNPLGDFMINDDWAFTRAMERFVSEGSIGSTGWGPSWAPGGPSLLAHLLWARLFTFLLGLSPTVLRISVLVAGILGSLAFYRLALVAGVSRSTSLFATFTLIFNPLFFSQCFTFMTDVTFILFATASMLFLYLGHKKNTRTFTVLGFAFALSSVLTRQIGLVVPIAFLLVSGLQNSFRDRRWRENFFYCLAFVVLPWILYEIFLFRAGGTPFTEHQVIHEIFRRPLTKGLFDYSMKVVAELGIGILYVGILTSPIIVILKGHFLSLKTYRIFALTMAAIFVALYAGRLTGWIYFPEIFHRNVIYNLGIGPVLLKDVYILGMHSNCTLPLFLYLILLYWATLSGGGLLCLAWISCGRLFSRHKVQGRQSDFLPAFAAVAALLYTAIILLTGFHDRYLISVCVLVLIWLISDPSLQFKNNMRLKSIVPGLTILVLMTGFSIAGTHDFLALKRSLKQAQDYVMLGLGSTPCTFDGGLEFNGYHCYKSDAKSGEGLSWWWVEREDYLLTLNPLAGYESIKQFPFKRYLGVDGQIHVLVRKDSSLPDPKGSP
ncbi:ArnT family glycosyltransferase [Desulfomonile tiedjei]|uniref:PMT family glycosyltransferase, 4-amino-4-deoxy-L-arabinose transferase n=1 Tax=Desulfomonile tiedjei (strain ATCC 49306 / DSM 6799 / DCB-1) TaxID=706587 RepID=I4C102_DESTA|nr:glycosyltransferase family 39 protein [Desulfomonile tiedjei]AFM23243.1 PMT family glycosyltransferase, 4-amino-4-deoxy-L-arabinose transferase [Desulfomonile tiedjei DSM 6799]